MNDQSRKALNEYYAEAASWNRDRVEGLRASRRTAWWVGGGAAAIAMLEGLALVFLMPLKTVEPYMLMVDRTTGYVQALDPLNPAKVATDTALTQSFLAQYVIAREGFDIATLPANYRRVSLFSADAARSSYLRKMQPANASNPLVAYPRTSLVEVRVKSVSPIAANTALVRFDTTQTDAGAQPRAPSAWVAVMRYRYSKSPMTLDDRLVNPLGFQVTGYRIDPEVAPAAPAESAAPGVAPQTAPSQAAAGSYYMAPAPAAAPETGR